MVKFILSLFHSWLFHLRNCTQLIKAEKKKEWFVNNMESVAILVLTIMGVVILLAGSGQLSSDYTVPRFKSVPWCGENSQIPC